MTDDEDIEWYVEIDPVGRNPDTDEEAETDPENMGGMVIYLRHGDWRKEEFSRVAFVRRASKHPDVPFDEQLDEELERAELACAALNRHKARRGLQ